MTDRQIVFLESNTTGTGRLFFERAENLGLEPVLLSDEPTRYPFLSKYRKIKIGAQTLESYRTAIERLAEDLPIGGIWSSSDRQVANAVRLARAFGVPQGSPLAIELCQDKYRCRHRLADDGQLTPSFALVHSASEAFSFASLDRSPVVVKPRSSTGSIGVRLCITADEALQHADLLFRADDLAKMEGILVESLIEGPEFSVEIFDGQAIGVTRKRLGAPPWFIEIGHEFPAAASQGVCDELKACAVAAVKSVGHIRGPAHVEVRLTAKGPCIVEINPRLAGGMIPDLVQRACGVDLISACLRFACGLSYDLTPSKHKAAAIRFLLRPQDKTVKSIAQIADATQLDGAAKVNIIDSAIGRHGPVQDFRDRIAYSIAEADAVEAAVLMAEAGLANLSMTTSSIAEDNKSG